MAEEKNQKPASTPEQPDLEAHSDDNKTENNETTEKITLLQEAGRQKLCACVYDFDCDYCSLYCVVCIKYESNHDRDKYFGGEYSAI